MEEPKDAGATDRESLRDLRQRIDGVLGGQVPRGSRCALLGYPTHANAGDSAIWLGERLWLSRHDCELVYECSPGSYSREHLASFGNDVLLLLHGGGNLGDIWPREQRFRERVLRDFPARRIIQLPQTICFLNPVNLRRAGELMRRHPGLTLLCRDAESLKTAAALCERSLICPDSAFLLDESLLGPFPEPSEDVVWLCRADAEAGGLAMTVRAAGGRPVDWLREDDSTFDRARLSLAWRLKYRQSGWQGTRTALTALDALLAEQRLHRGCAQLARGRLVVTDRLHAHVLCLLLRIRHIVADNSYGKLSSFYRTWTSRFTLTQWAETAEAAVGLATSGCGPARASRSAGPANPPAAVRPAGSASRLRTAGGLQAGARRLVSHYLEAGAAETAVAMAKTARRSLRRRLRGR